MLGLLAQPKELVTKHETPSPLPYARAVRRTTDYPSTLQPATEEFIQNRKERLGSTPASPDTIDNVVSIENANFSHPQIKTIQKSTSSKFLARLKPAPSEGKVDINLDSTKPSLFTGSRDIEGHGAWSSTDVTTEIDDDINFQAFLRDEASLKSMFDGYIVAYADGKKVSIGRNADELLAHLEPQYRDRPLFIKTISPQPVSFRRPMHMPR